MRNEWAESKKVVAASQAREVDGDDVDVEAVAMLFAKQAKKSKQEEDRLPRSGGNKMSIFFSTAIFGKC